MGSVHGLLRAALAVGCALVWGFVVSVPVTHAAVYPMFGEQTVGGTPDAVTHDCPTTTTGGEPVESCAALADRLSSLRWRVGAVHDSLRSGLAGIGDQLDSLGGLPADVATTNAKLSTLHDDLTDVVAALDLMAPATAGGTPAFVALSATDRQTIEDAQGSMHADVWFLAGLLAAAMAAFQLHRVFTA